MGNGIDGATPATANVPANQQDVVPARGGAFRGKTVAQIVKIGKNRDPEGAVRYLFQLSKNGNEEALRALKGAGRTAHLNPQCTFSALAKSAMSPQKSEAKKQSAKSVSVRQASRPVKTRQERYKALTELLKSEYRGMTNPVTAGMDLWTGKAETSERRALTIGEFHETLEGKGVANIAVVWFEELERLYQAAPDITAKKRVEIQTGLVNVLNELKRAPICALEKVRESRSSNNSKEFLHFLKGSIQLEYQSLNRIIELQSLFRNERLEKLRLAAKDLDAAGMNRIKTLRGMFPQESLEELSDTAKRPNAAGMINWLKELQQWFPQETFEHLWNAVANLGDKGMERLKELQQRFPQETLRKLWAAANGLNDGSMKRLFELKPLYPNKSLEELRRAANGLNDGSMKRLVELKPMFPQETLEELRRAANGLNDDSMKQVIAQKLESPDKSLQELLNVTTRL